VRQRSQRSSVVGYGFYTVCSNRVLEVTLSTPINEIQRKILYLTVAVLAENINNYRCNK